MAAHAGDKVRGTGDVSCASCDDEVHVTQGHALPECPSGHTTFAPRRNAPGNES